MKAIVQPKIMMEISLAGLESKLLVDPETLEELVEQGQKALESLEPQVESDPN